MSDKYPTLSTGGYLRAENGRLLLGAHFYHPDVGVGYVGEDGTERQIHYRHNTTHLRGVVVNFDDLEDVDPVRVEVFRGGEYFPGAIESAVTRAMTEAGIKVSTSEPEVL